MRGFLRLFVLPVAASLLGFGWLFVAISRHAERTASEWHAKYEPCPRYVSKGRLYCLRGDTTCLANCPVNVP